MSQARRARAAWLGVWRPIIMMLLYTTVGSSVKGV